MNASTLPLTDHPRPDSVIAWRADGPVSRNQFLADVAALAALFPPGGHVLNTCQDRYHFLVGLAAAAVAGRVSLLPPNLTDETVARLAAGTPDLLCIHDGQGAVGGLPGLAIPPSAPVGADPLPVPRIPVERVIAHVYTSGSTGVPGTHTKTWGSLVVKGLAEAERLGAAGHVLVGTVPAQHMYGFESTVLICLHGGAALWHGRPFYPADIAAALAAVPQPRKAHGRRRNEKGRHRDCGTGPWTERRGDQFFDLSTRALALIQGIMSRSWPPTFSIWWSALRRR